MNDTWKNRISFVIVIALILSAIIATLPVQSWNNNGEQTTKTTIIPTYNSAQVTDKTGDEQLVAPAEADTDTWIIRWEEEEHPEFTEQSEIVSRQSFLEVTVAKPRDGVDAEEWLQRWSQSPDVRYIQPNHLIRTAAIPNDPQHSSQRYLATIGAYDAWDQVTSNTSITIAVVDTGVDLNHPDLKANLVAGQNFLDANKTPQDDNGHGTNVAGIIAAQGNNRIGTAGILWNAKIMPLKTLDKTGYGNEDKLGEAIRYAVDNGAKIVVMSLGLHRYSPYLQDIVSYAEQRNVLLVAAAGNEGSDVKYPAAYPSVLAVGGIGSNRSIVQESNYGPELDLVAPWEVFTTGLDGKYHSNYGTSMAAPQVAAVAAMVMAQHPDWTPAQIRNHLRYTAEDIGSRGWDERTGYGLLRADRALTMVATDDMYEPNNSRNTAVQLPVDHSILAELSGGSDDDWFYVQPAYDGKLTLKIKAAPGTSTTGQVDVEHYDASGNLLNSYPNMLGKSMTLPVTKARSYVKLSQPNDNSTQQVAYELTTSFTIYTDEYEDNDRQYKAYRLQARSQVLKGTFHQQNDFDWFQIPITQDGTLRVKVSVDTSRIDPAIVIQRQGGNPITVDAGREGEMEYSDPIEVKQGTYYILIKNVISETTYPVQGEYLATIEYSPKFVDPNEPNDRAYQAVMMAVGTPYNGVISSSTDQDWFTFMVESESMVDLRVVRIPKNRTMSLAIYDASQKMMSVHTSRLGDEEMNINTQLDEGLYYVRLMANAPFQDQMYGLTVDIREMTAGLVDIHQHWAKDAIVGLVEQDIVKGYGDQTFRPNASLTRAEAVTMIVRAFGLEQQSNIAYPDVTARHWAYREVNRASTAGITRGYPDGTFRPDQRVTRVEMAQMLGNALKLTPLAENPGFTDVPEDFWAVGMLAALKKSDTLSGYPDGSFRPGNTASRAEFASLLYKSLSD